MWPDRQQHGFNGGCFVRLQFIGQQSFLAVQFEFVDEHTRKVAFLFLAQLWILKNGLDGFIQCFFVASVQLFGHPVERWRGADLQHQPNS